ncbi:unnamed protein product [Ilex paraguariensis]|uniref:Uncharacterized protein n=1 Tax=Ilex paraguariensis TaxID=185542 RepID=A0ABC8S1A2_9AQUA
MGFGPTHTTTTRTRKGRAFRARLGYVTFEQISGYTPAQPKDGPSALAAVFIEGLIFLLVSAVGLRAKLIPKPVRISSSAGIGLFLAFIRLQNGGSGSNIRQRHRCSHSRRHCFRRHHVPEWSHGKFHILARSHRLYYHRVLLSEKYQWRYDLWDCLRNRRLVFSHRSVSENAGRNSSCQYFKKVVDVHKIESTAGALTFKSIGKGYFWEALFTFLYVDILDTTGTMYSMARFAGFTDINGDFVEQYFAFISDAFQLSLSDHCWLLHR